MNRVLGLIIILLFLLSSCNDDCDFEQAIITGIDFRECFCCGGFMINFNNNPIPYDDEFKLAYELPDGSGITYESEFPIDVRIVWVPLYENCDVIEVRQIRVM